MHARRANRVERLRPEATQTVTFEDTDTTEAHERRITRCRSCRAQIIFLPTTAAGKSMPVNADTVAPSDAEYVPDRHISHFATCPDAKAFRKRGRK